MRILIVCFTESTHSQSWVNLFEDESEFDVRVFEHNFVDATSYLQQRWAKPTYVLQRPLIPREGARIIPLFPNTRYARFLAARISHRFPLNDFYLQRVINKWRPHIVHSLSLPSSFFTWQVLRRIKSNRPLFVLSSWGSDINIGKEIPEDRIRIKELLSNCSGFIADCDRDIRNALDLGLAEDKLALEFAVPATGGIDFRKETGSIGLEGRNIILVPKAIEAFANKTLPVLEALNMVRTKIEQFEVHLLAASNEVKAYLMLMPESFRKFCKVHPQLPQEEVIQLMKRSRVVIAPSISDGTPMTLLESMSAGALPIFSPLDSIKEWIEDGKNGLLVHALYPNEIARALIRGLADDELFNSAAVINREIISKRADRQDIQFQVMNYYRRLLAPPRNKETGPPRRYAT